MAAVSDSSPTTPLHGRLGLAVTTPNADGTGTVPSLAAIDDTGANYTPITLTGTTTMPAYPGLPSYSRDGKQFAFLNGYCDTSGCITELWIANADGSGTHKIWSGQGVDASHDIVSTVWAADGKTLYLGTRGGAGSTAPLYQIDVDGTGLQPVPGLQPGAYQIQPEVLADGRLAYSDGSNDVIVFDPKTKVSTTAYTKLTGALPFALSPDGTKIAVMEPQPGNAEGIDLYNIDGTGMQVISTISGGISLGIIPALWSPDGAELAYIGATGIFVHRLSATGTANDFPIKPTGTGVVINLGSWIATSASPTPTPPPTTPPTTPPATPPGGATGVKVYRDAGGDRVQTGIAISQQRWTGVKSAKAVVLATSLNFPDALSGGPLAAKKGGPLLLTDGSATHIDAHVLDEIRRVLPAGGPIHVLGGDGAMNPAIVTQLKSLGYAVTQYKGSDRADTALRVARDGMGSPQHVVLATGTGFADALAAGPYAAGPFADAPGAPAAIVLSNGATLDPATQAFLAGKTVATVGAQAGHAWPGATKSFPGTDRFDTAARVAAEFTGQFANTQVGIANGVASGSNPGYPDALTGGAFMAESNGPIVLVDGIGGTVPAASQAVLASRTGNTRADIFGGTSVIPPSLATSIVALLHGTAQF
jgi:hypothetical protein